MKIAPLYCVLSLVLSATPAFAQFVHIKVPLTVSDGSGERTTVYFGVDPGATTCIDPQLGEFELPADRCGSAEVCAYFTDPPFDTSGCFGSGLLLDLRPYALPIQVDLYSLVFSTSDYPVTLHWPGLLGANYDSVIVRDEINGSIIYANMVTADSVVISSPTITGVIITASGPRGFLDGVKDRPRSPRQTQLYPNFPNPFNPSTTISYSLGKSSRVDLGIYDVMGRRAATLVNKDQPAGHYAVVWNAERFPGGIYYCRMETSTGSVTRSIVLIK